MDNRKLWFVPGRPVRGSRFDISRNSVYQLTEDGATVTHTGIDQWNTTTLDTQMKTTQAHWAHSHFRLASFKNNADIHIMIGVVSSSFAQYTSYPQGNGYYVWLAYFYSSKLSS